MGQSQDGKVTYNQGCSPKKEDGGGRKDGTPDTRLYETSIETVIMDHFTQKYTKGTP